MISKKEAHSEAVSSQDRPENTVYNTTATHEDKSHQIISSYFIGPQAENLDYFKENIHAILEELERARHAYFPGDGKFISKETQQTEAFIRSKDKLKNAVRKASNIIARASIPFWSPRYQAHMCTDMSMTSLLGYFMTMLYNPNNVALEASPVSTVAEIEVGEQLCELFGYNTQSGNTEGPTAWGHVTCDGTVANLELTIYTKARNLKFDPLALRKAFDPNQKLNFLSEDFYVETCKGERKLFAHMSNWELLNLKPSDILDLPDGLYQEHGVSNALKPGTAVAICGLGSDNVVGITVDLGARLDLGELDKRLRHNLEEKQPVLAVVGIMGSTEESFADSITVDPHIAGYTPYPASGLCYRDGRMHFLVTWEAPYLSRGSVTSIGIYGVEGSKPGAAAMSTWLANKTIGLHPEGYGALLGEVTWTCTRLSAEWAALTNAQSPFTCVPFNMLPSERSEHTTEAKVQAEKARIRREIIERTNAETFYGVVKKETEIVLQSNKMASVIHKFLIQGMGKIYLIHLPMFHVANYRQQLIVSASFDATAKAKYDGMKQANPTEPLILVTKHKVMLKDVVECSGKFQAHIMTKASGIIIQDVDVSLEAKVVSRPLNSKWRLEKYPDTYMPFYLYGTASEANIDHVIVRAPNTQLSAGRCELDFYQEVESTIWEKNLILLIENVREEPMQPFPPNSEIGSNNGAIVAHDSYNVDVKTIANQGTKFQVSDGVGEPVNGVKNGFSASESDPYKEAITRPRGQPKNPEDCNEIQAQIYEEDRSPRLHTAARVVNSETRSGSA
ncbi:pyridoxal-dependent decarboxylase domain protein [Apiospora phragmitis]|uniref:Pyridoxal-dependent decarboxylase domain protein n=1 Tax=Apiospora phragmitis TaxID=2905665 RepID=A0ABR1VD15_9PEZI